MKIIEKFDEKKWEILSVSLPRKGDFFLLEDQVIQAEADHHSSFKLQIIKRRPKFQYTTCKGYGCDDASPEDACCVSCHNRNSENCHWICPKDPKTCTQAITFDY